jgi:hypothetical protein
LLYFFSETRERNLSPHISKDLPSRIQAGHFEIMGEAESAGRVAKQLKARQFECEKTYAVVVSEE